MERHALVSDAAGSSQVLPEPLTPLVRQVPIGAAGELMEKPVVALVPHGLNEDNEAKALQRRVQRNNPFTLGSLKPRAVLPSILD